MEEEKVIGSTATIPKIDIRKLDFEEGEDANTVWTTDLKTAICATREGIIKSMLFTIVTTGKCYEPIWPTEDTVKQKYPGLTERRQQELILKKLEEKAAHETTQLEDAKGTSHSILKGLMSKNSIDVLVTDMEYKANAQLMTPDPAITYGRINATHILERNGKDLQRMVLSKTKLIHQFTELKQGEDHIVDYLERNERSILALKVAGVDIKTIYKTDEELIVKFLYGLCQNRYGGFIRDVSNKLISIPNTFAEVISLAKERKELAGQDRKSRADSTAFLTANSSGRSETTDTEKSDRTAMISIMGKPELHPLTPYDRIAGKDWYQLSTDEKTTITRHNKAIEAAGITLAQKGWVDGRYHMNRNPTKDGTYKGRHSRFKKKAIPDEEEKEKEKKDHKEDHTSFLTRMQQADDDGVNMNMVLMMDGDEVIDSCSQRETNSSLLTMGQPSTPAAEANLVLMAAHINNNPFNEDLVVLDCASGLNLCKSRKHAHNIQDCQPGTVSGITGDGPNNTYHQSCNLISEELGRVPFLPTAVANIISLAGAKDRGFSVEYQNDKDEFTIISPEGWRYTFGRMSGDKKSKFYVLDLNTQHKRQHALLSRGEGGIPTHALLSRGEGGIPTVSGNKDKYTVRENKGAVKARQYMATMGYPPINVALQQAKSMINCPVTDNDIRRAFDIYGPSLAAIRGSTKQTRTAAAEIEIGTSIVQQEQSCEVDLMFVRGNTFIVCILSPLEFSIVVPVKDKTAIEISKALESVIAASKAKGFIIKWIRSDNEPALTKAEVIEMLQRKGISIDKVAPGKHASKAERRIQFIKQKLRTIKAGLPYNMSMEMSKHAVLAANRFTNMQQASSSTSTLSPREKFLGRSFDYKKDGGIQFGTYVQATVVTTDNSDRKRTESCIALYPKEASTATMYVMKIKGQKVVARSNLIVMPLPDALASMMDADAEYDGLGNTYTNGDEDTGEEDEQTVYEAPEGSTVAHFQPTNAGIREILQPAPEQPESQHQLIENEPSTNEVEESHEQLTEANQVEAPVVTLQHVEKSPEKMGQNTGQSSRRSSRIAYNEKYPYWQPQDDVNQAMIVTCEEYCNDYVFNMTSKQAIRKHGEIAADSIRGELTQLIKMETFTPVHLTMEQRKNKGSYICSKMFVKEKLLPSGATDKIKSRLVGRGDMQTRDDYGDEDLSATTADLSSVLIAAGIAAHEDREVATLDFTSAYLNATMDPNAPEVIMKVDTTCTAIIITIDPSYSDYRTESGELFVKLNRCLYGCIESAKRWQNHLTGTLASLGFIPNPQDTCVFNMMGASGLQITIIVYVDDLLITSKSKLDIETVVRKLEKTYPNIKYEIGPVHDYIGMNLDFTVSGTVSITMDGMVRDIVATSATKDLDKKSSSPARENLFTVDLDEEPVTESDRQTFHSTVQKIAYVAKRARPECLGAISFLQTRVTKATPSDLYKLDQVIRYLHQTPNRGIRIKPGAAGIVIRTFADSSYGVHWDGKSHSGLCIHLGDYGCVHVSSKRQTIVTKSSTEAELVCASDSGNQVLHLRQFLINQGYPSTPAIMYQDNMSTIALIEKGMSTSVRSRHINVRYFWLRERMDDKEISITHLGTELMGPANILTKAVQGAQFEKERMQLTHW